MDKAARAILSAARNLAAGRLVHGQGFARDHGFVERTCAFHDTPLTPQRSHWAAPAAVIS